MPSPNQPRSHLLVSTLVSLNSSENVSAGAETDHEGCNGSGVGLGDGLGVGPGLLLQCGLVMGHFASATSSGAMMNAEIATRTSRSRRISARRNHIERGGRHQAGVPVVVDVLVGRHVVGAHRGDEAV